MTIKEFIDQHPDVEVHFTSYYKYIFSFEGVLRDGRKFTVFGGGDSGDIYKYSVKPTMPLREVIVHSLAIEGEEAIHEYW